MVENNLWVEKYRPRELDDLIINDEYRQVMQSWIDNREIPSTLLVGKQGSGKTTLARILISKVIADKRMDLLQLNGSSQRGIDVVRNTIEPFLQSIMMSDGKIKVVFIDEFDYMTDESMHALRNIIEKYSDNGRFLTTANHESKIIPALHSRFQTFKFNVLPKDDIKKYCVGVLKSENVTYEDNILDKIILESYPDVRKIIGTLQSKTVNGILSVNISDIISKEKEIISYFTDIYIGIKENNSNVIQQSYSSILKILKEYEVDFMTLYSNLFDNEYTPAWAQIKICEYSSKHINCFNPRMNFQTLLIEIIKTGRELRKI